jgi:hypothetical protein
VTELVVSELMTNGLRASAGLTTSRFAGKSSVGTPPVRLWLHSDGARGLIQVWDGDDGMPARQDVDPGAESGRRLLIVESLASGWGVSPGELQRQGRVGDSGPRIRLRGGAAGCGSVAV